VNLRSANIAKIHMAKAQLGWDDDRYRSFLLGVTGKFSCSELTLEETAIALEHLQKQGFQVKVKGRSTPPKNTPQQRKIWRLWYLLREHSYTSGSAKALNAFIKKTVGVERIEWLTPPQANAVIEGLKAICQREGVRLD